MQAIETEPTLGASGMAVETNGIVKRFGERVAIDRVDLRVPMGSAFGFLGPNGAGKTTMIRMLLGLTHASAGTMSLLGRPVPADRASALARVGAIVEEPRFHPHLSGRENLRIIAAVRGPQATERIVPALRRVGLTDRADEKVKRYSLGMRQRLGVARCLLADPLLLILDEPTNGLDPGGIQEFRMMIRAMVEQEGRTIFLSSHLLDEVEKICDHAAIVDRGKIVMQGAIAELASGGRRSELIVGVDDPERALLALDGLGAVSEAHRSDEGLRVVLAGDLSTAAEVNARLVAEGLAVMRLEPVRQSLEQRFLEITSRLGGDAKQEVAAREVQA
jgi:ABC-2 type transport system ATP-binding protein